MKTVSTPTAIERKNEQKETTGDVDDKNGAQRPGVAKVVKKKKWKKPKDKPKRPLSAYNIFFRHERENLLYGEGIGHKKPVKIGFAALAKDIAAKWKRLESENRRIYEVQAEVEQIRYKGEVEAWKRNQDGVSSISVSGAQESYWPPRRDGVAKVLAANSNKPSPEERICQQQSRNALVNQLMISQLMSNYNDPSAMMNGVATHNFMGQQFSNPLMVHAEVQSQLNYLTGGESPLDSLWAYQAASVPRRMSMPTSMEQFSQMQHQQQEQQQQQQQQQQQHQQQLQQLQQQQQQQQQHLQAEQMATAGFPGEQSLSIMSHGIIDNTQNTHMIERRSSMPMGADYQQQQPQNIHMIERRSSMPMGSEYQQQQPGPSFDDLLAQAHSAAADLGSYTEDMISGGGRRIPSNAGAGIEHAGRRMSMPLSVEQQMLDRSATGFPSAIPQQCRSMSMPMGYNGLGHNELQHEPIDDHRSLDCLDDLVDILKDEVVDILKDDGDLFDW